MYLKIPCQLYFYNKRKAIPVVNRNNSKTLKYVQRQLIEICFSRTKHSKVHP